MGGSESKSRDQSGATTAAGAIAGLAILAVAAGVAALMGDSSTSDGRRTMKAPGRDMRILRDDFERDTASYFRDLRRK
ncbi:BSD domain-containing protein [Psidium guajava]|nr:BSD domain-containing protein [Psidium guajava]